jgi:PIN domain nuclease of toxin-antitoxin system
MTESDLLVLDTHVWIWWVSQDDQLPAVLRGRIGQAKRIAVSAAPVY